LPRRKLLGSYKHGAVAIRSYGALKEFASDNRIPGYISTLVRIRAAFEDAGVTFIDEDENAGLGLRLSRKKRRR
jgi:hypothetical protein